MHDNTFFKEYKLPIAILTIGIVCILISGVLFFKTQYSNSTSSAITINQSESTVSANLTMSVDIEGAVVKPGVYSFPANARVADAIEKAGGFTTEADSGWIAKTLNKAKILIDGEKIYIPSVSDSQSEGRTIGASDASNKSGLININSASQNELESLPGVGEKTAQKIIAGRPYSSTAELVEKKIVYQNVFEKIKESISIY